MNIITKLIKNKKFYILSDIILNKFILNINIANNELVKLRIMEIEIYYYSDDHKDEYVHCNKDQLQFGKLYFHKFPNGTFKAGTFKGMDLCFSDNINYCGILIRSLFDISKNQFIHGPSTSVTYILNLIGYNNVEDFMKQRNYELINFFNKNEPMFIEILNDKFNNEIYCGKRIGLNNDKYPEYRNLKYRFCLKGIKKEVKMLEKNEDILIFNQNCLTPLEMIDKILNNLEKVIIYRDILLYNENYKEWKIELFIEQIFRILNKENKFLLKIFKNKIKYCCNNYTNVLDGIIENKLMQKYICNIIIKNKLIDKNELLKKYDENIIEKYNEKLLLF